MFKCGFSRHFLNQCRTKINKRSAGHDVFLTQITRPKVLIKVLFHLDNDDSIM